MKVLVNGGVNLSELDGWWAEAYVPDLGWAIGDGKVHGSDSAWDAAEAEALYERLEREVIPEFYTRNDKGIPTAWVNRMRESMARLTPHFAADRTVREYTEQHYLPAAIACQSRIANKGIIGKQEVDWRHNLDQKWATLHFGQVKVETKGDQQIFEIQVCLHGLDPKTVRVELFADGFKGNPPVRQEMTLLHPLADETGSYIYGATVSASRPQADYTARVLPHYEGVAIPLEDARILWQH
jgi:starch phosphorylase